MLGKDRQELARAQVIGLLDSLSLRLADSIGHDLFVHPYSEQVIVLHAGAVGPDCHVRRDGGRHDKLVHTGAAADVARVIGRVSVNPAKAGKICRGCIMLHPAKVTG